MADDPINPAHYAGRACADIGERLTANGYQILKYVWRLGRKDSALVELGKAMWYADSEHKMLTMLDKVGRSIRTAPLVLGLADPDNFLLERVENEPMFTREIAVLLWEGYNTERVRVIYARLERERAKYESS